MGAPKENNNSAAANSASLPEVAAKAEEAQLFNLKNEQTDLGRGDSMKFAVLSAVLNEDYDKAIKKLRDFLQEPSPYPNFKSRVTRFINHSIDLVFAIKAKRNFPGINSLTRAKQQELREKFKEHFKELQYILSRVEKVENDLRIDDVRSTIYVVRALWVAAASIVLMAFILEFIRGLAHTGMTVFDDTFTHLIEWLFESIGW